MEEKSLQQKIIALELENAEFKRQLKERHIKKCINDLGTELLRGAKLIDVIQIELTRGHGNEKNPARKVLAFYLPNGNYVGEIDPLVK